MPVIQAGSKSLPPLDGHLCGQQWFCSRLAVLVFIITVVLAGLILPRQSLRRKIPERLIRVSPAGQDIISWTSGAPICSTLTNFLTASGRWVRLKQGQGRFEKQANRAVSRGEASGTATVGSGGSREGGKMEEKERVSAGSRSRGVSTSWHDGAGLSGGLSSHDQLLATAEQREHVGTSSERGAAGFHVYPGSMEGARFERISGVSAGYGSGTTQGTRGHISISLFGGQHMADDEHILYGVKDTSHSCSTIGKWSPSHRQLDLSFSRSPPSALTPTTSAFGFSPGPTAHGSPSNGIAIPSRIGAGSHTFQETGDESLDGDDRAIYRLGDGSSPSSYPPASPLLPPPPPLIHGAFDPAAVMFPGPARDGGIRMVPAHNHSESDPSGVRGEVASGPADSGASWARHTRVYGGGVCLACAAAAAAAGGEGGFYGDSVRPEDKR